MRDKEYFGSMLNINKISQNTVLSLHCNHNIELKLFIDEVEECLACKKREKISCLLIFGTQNETIENETSKIVMKTVLIV